jgi:uncharacterized membrane protein YebE (DUF533 family)
MVGAAGAQGAIDDAAERKIDQHIAGAKSEKRR